MKEQYLEVGKITNVHGLMGEVRSSPGPTPPTFCASLKHSMWIRPTGPSRWSGPVHKNMVILKLNGVNRCERRAGYAQRSALH